ncbi:amino acid permease [Dyella tabacisoli]|uniref:Amino acid permease n=1 Tax=Dyella tabacisoli TaxID=2282381 RepID=A0A369UM26_9GAMM|nr:amino acid permease [Dyella tabacisoli]RDD81646.1 amino acid permease [Dyella tabacisoli]
MSLLRSLFAVKPVEASLSADNSLKRTLGLKELIVLGVGAVIGAGIFVITGQTAAEHAGPAITLSFILAGLAAALAALSYAEFAAMLPVSGSAYVYAYATFGELLAWFIGWNVVAEYLLAVSSVAVGWSGYGVGLLHSLGLQIPDVLTHAPLSFKDGQLAVTGAWFNLPAVLVVAALTALLYRGTQQSTLFASVVVVLKVLVVLLFVVFGLQYVNPELWHPYMPANQGGDHYGWSGVFRAATSVFFAYIGFDAVATAAQETRDPQRNVPMGILISLAICTVLYIIVAAVLTGLVPYQQLATAEPVATALAAHPQLAWLKLLTQVGAVAGLTSVILVMHLGLSRILYSMAGDGLLPRFFGAVHAQHRTPHRTTLLVGLVGGLLAAVFPLSLLGDLLSMGTLLAFSTVCIGVLVLRRTHPNLLRGFRVPAAPVTCSLGVLVCLFLLMQMNKENWLLLAGWTVLGMLIYVGYGYRHSRLRKSR